MKEILKEIEGNKILLKIDKNIYEKEAILQASYMFTNSCFLNIELVDNFYEVIIQAKTNTNLEKIALEFGNEIIDQQIRIQTGKEFKEIREQLVQKAFSSINK